MRWVFLLFLGVLAGCQILPAQNKAGVEPVAAEHALPQWQSPRERDHERVGQIIDLRSGTTVTVEQMLAELADASVVLLGEKHDNPDHHALQLWLLKALETRRKQGSVVMEMLTVNQQETVTQVQEKIRAGDMPQDLPLALDWHKGWDWQQYGALVTHVLKQPYPLLAGNLNRDALMDIYRNPPELTGIKSTRTDVVERLSEQIRESHCNKLPEAQLPAMLAVQQQRDRSMAAVVLAAAKPTLFITGAFHAFYDLGVPLHLQDLQGVDKLTQRVLIFAEADQDVPAESADFIWFTPAVEEQDYCADL
ncbi:iron(III) ABC transporter [Pseudomonas sp. C27(2019)]|uniref:ChaN family lipoprotein n=1 Tax=Pseudomonas sp. C27(2019) TaxID=2604941 RepID=UPI001248AF30|nr:ChaN family lipoprotein [Pseudomonas sp. C27(2019)]QEY59468.1 iron(III) ABC transporter [Pseudomonas sp. C27(2019)]